MEPTGPQPPDVSMWCGHRPWHVWDGDKQDKVLGSLGRYTCPFTQTCLGPSSHLDSSGLPVSLGFPRNLWDSGPGKARVGVGGQAALGCLIALVVTWLSHLPPTSALNQDARGTGLARDIVSAEGHPSVFSLGASEGGWETGEGSGHGRAAHGASPGCYSLGFLLG